MPTRARSICFQQDLSTGYAIGKPDTGRRMIRWEKNSMCNSSKRFDRRRFLKDSLLAGAAGGILAAALGSHSSLAGEQVAASSAKVVRVVLPPKSNDLLEKILGVFSRQVAKRCPARVTTQGEAPLTVALTLDPAIGSEGFRISGRGGGIEVAGQNELGVLYGLGKLLRTSRYSQEGFTPGSWRGQSVPQKPIRGIYFATHFHNFYHEAPIEEVQHYVAELALWGFNTLLVWYDMHHFDGLDDPKAAAFRKRLYAICKAARDVGLEIGLITIANEAYNNSPAELRVGADVHRGGWYDCAVCPEKTGRDGRSGLDYILGVLGEEFDWIAPLRPKYVVIWPYDQGGCGCEKCRPWGSNGFVRTGAKVAGLARKKLPGVKVVASTWYLNREEWAGMAKAMTGKDGWADVILSEGHIWKLDGRPMVGFPEISMHGMFPWGGFGASVLAARAARQWDGVKAASDGGFPYSEGIYEDITKVACSQLYWSDRPPAETLREYIAYEYSPEHVDALYKVMMTLEQNHHFRWWPEQLAGADIPAHWIPNRGAKPQPDPGAEDAWATVQQVDKALPQWSRSSWRWRVFYLRALLDARLKANGGTPDARCNEAFEELIRIYHAQGANPVLRPPAPRKK